MIATRATYVSDAMLHAASEALSEFSTETQLLPRIDQALDATHAVALAVAKKAIEEGHTAFGADADLEALINAATWEPSYLPYQKS